jgi:signal transduction histidine kinase
VELPRLHFVKNWKPLPVFVAVLAVYLPVQALLFFIVGDDSTLSLAVVPVLFSGWFLGPWWAASAGGTTIACYLAYKFLSTGEGALVEMVIGSVSVFVFVCIGLAIGKVEELNRRLRKELDARKIAEEALFLRTQQLDRSNRELEQFAYIASHDLQEPLRKISAFGDRLATKFKAVLGEQGQDYLGRMLNATVRMQSLIEGLLTYSRVTTKAQPFAPVDLSAIAAGVLGDLETKIRETGAVVRCDVSAAIEADSLQMRQLFQNLIGNALKYHAPGVAPMVTVRCSADGAACTLSVSDNGIGFEQKYAEQIFGVFQRLHGRSSPYEGSGIGLSVCRKIAQRHNGTISAKGDPGKGAVFTVTLPVHQASVKESGTQKT